MTENIITGRCLCGDIHYEVSGEVVWSGYCHCESCRRFTGTTVTNWLGVKDTDLTFTRGQPKIYGDDNVQRGFCADCGSSLTYAAKHFPNYIQLHLGTLDEPDGISPMAHVHCEEKVAWLNIADDLPRFLASAAAEGESWKKPEQI